MGNTANNSVTRCNSMGQLRWASSGLDYPWGLACDSSGNLYVANALNNTIQKFVGREQGTLFTSSGLRTTPIIRPRITSAGTAPGLKPPQVVPSSAC